MGMRIKTGNLSVSREKTIGGDTCRDNGEDYGLRMVCIVR